MTIDVNVSADKSASARMIVESLATLPPLPATAQEILTCFGDEFIDANKVSEVIEGDPGICAKLLGVANSAYFGLLEPVNGIREAVSRVLGVDTVRSLVLAMAIQRIFKSRNCPAFDATRFWMQSLLTAECCKKLAKADSLVADAASDLAYSAGLCHNIGLLALAHLEPDRTNAALRAQRMNPKPGRLGELLIAEFNSDHKMMTLELSRLWSLPEPMVAAYHLRAYPDLASDDRFGFIIAAGAAVVGNTEADEDQQTDLGPWANALSLAPNNLQSMAVFGDRQKDRVLSLASNMSV